MEKLKNEKTFYIPEIDYEMVYIEPNIRLNKYGSFKSIDKGFFIGITPITRKQWSLLIDEDIDSSKHNIGSNYYLSLQEKSIIERYLYHQYSKVKHFKLSCFIHFDEIQFEKDSYNINKDKFILGLVLQWLRFDFKGSYSKIRKSDTKLFISFLKKNNVEPPDELNARFCGSWKYNLSKTISAVNNFLEWLKSNEYLKIIEKDHKLAPTKYGFNKEIETACPVGSNYNGSQKFIKKLNEFYPAANFRLPTTDEWHYAFVIGYNKYLEKKINFIIDDHAWQNLANDSLKIYSCNYQR